jgi:hypothetical protein
MVWHSWTMEQSAHWTPDQVSGDIQWLHPMGNGEVWYRNQDSLGIYRYHAGRSERMLSTAATATRLRLS